MTTEPSTAEPSTAEPEPSLIPLNAVFADDFAPSSGDGVRTDVDGNVWCAVAHGDAAEDGVRCYTPEGTLIGKIHLPEGVANLCFGGPRRNRLFMAASTSVYALYLSAEGAQTP